MIRIQRCKFIIVVSCINLTFIVGPAVLVASYFYLPVLQPRYSLVIIVSCSDIIDSWPL